jgi:hypothetical protein
MELPRRTQASSNGARDQANLGKEGSAETTRARIEGTEPSVGYAESELVNCKNP